MRRGTLLVAALACGCTTNAVLTPTRSLDRPSDVALVCVIKDARGVPTTVPLELCRPGAVSATQSPELYLFVANTNRGEVAVAGGGHDDMGAGIIDLDPDRPGFGFIPVGPLPDPMRATADGCFAIATDQGSCDFAWINVRDTIARANNPYAATGKLLSSVVERLVPQTPGGIALEGRATWLEFMPAPIATTDGGVVPPTPASPLDGGGLDLSPPTVTPGGCANTYEALVAYPECELLARVSIAVSGGAATATIKQAFRITPNGTSEVTNLESLRCASECAGGVALPPGLDMSAAADDAGAGGGDAAIPAPDGGAATDGGTSGVDAALPPILPAGQSWPSNFAIDDTPGKRQVLVGDSASPRIIVIGVDDQNTLTQVKPPVLLSGTATGVERVRISPRVAALADNDAGPRYLYAIARDRTVRVVETGSLVECETNPDPDTVEKMTTNYSLAALEADLMSPNQHFATAAKLRCLPVGVTPRASTATTAGLTLPNFSLPRDIAFTNNPNPPQSPLSGTSAAPASPFVLLGTFAWIVDSAGQIVVVNIADQCPQPNVPGSVNQNGCQPADFTNSVNAAFGNAGAPQPRAIDVMPNRLRTGLDRFKTLTSYTDTTGGGPRVLERPTVTVGGLLQDSQALQRQLPNVCDVGSDATGTPPVGCQTVPDTIAGTEKVVPQRYQYFAVRDPQALLNETWSLSWEGLLPLTNRVTGTFVGVAGSAWGVALADSSASFCSRGVEGADIAAGDKVFMGGCSDDTNCGPDQICFKDPSTPLINLPSGLVANLGLCVDRDPRDRTLAVPAVRDVQKNVCAPWSQSILHYRVAEARQNQLILAELPLPEHPVDTRACTSNADCVDVVVSTYADRQHQISGTNPVLLPTSCLSTGAAARECLVGCTTIGSNKECGVGYVCRVPSDPSQVEPRCLRAPLPRVVPAGKACVHDDDCRPASLAAGDFGSGAYCFKPPGVDLDNGTGQCKAACFSELQGYEVHAGEAFVAVGVPTVNGGPFTGFLSNNRPADPNAPDSACVLGPTDGPQRLVRGRIPLLAPTSAGIPRLPAPPACPSDVSTMNWLGPIMTGPNTCLITPPSAAASAGRLDQPGDAIIRYDNPLFSLVVFVPPRPLPAVPGSMMIAGAPQYAPADNTVIQFSILGGFHSLVFPLGTDIAAQMPRSVVTGPWGLDLFVVDEGKQTVGTGLRGQVLRFLTDSQVTDSTFQVR